MHTPAPATNLVMRDYAKQPRRTGPAAVRNVIGWDGRDASHVDSFDRARQQRAHLAAVMTLRGSRGPGDPDACELYPGQSREVAAQHDTESIHF